MPISLSQLKMRQGSVTLYENQGDANALHVEYHLWVANTMDADLEEAKVMKTATPEEAVQIQAEKVVRRVAKWDLLGEDGKPVELTAKAIRSQVPYDLLVDILTAIRKDQDDPNSKRGGDASGTTS